VGAGQIPPATDDEVQQGVVREQAGRAAERIWGGREEGAHRMGLSMAEWIGGGGKVTASRSGGHQHGCRSGTLPRGAS
jgi:hypothetical protein